MIAAAGVLLSVPDGSPPLPFGGVTLEAHHGGRHAQPRCGKHGWDPVKKECRKCAEGQNYVNGSCQPPTGGNPQPIGPTTSGGGCKFIHYCAVFPRTEAGEAEIRICTITQVCQ